MPYQPFLVAPFKNGIHKYLKPWLSPNDAFQSLDDCYSYRGVVNKRYGYSLLHKFPNRVGYETLAVTVPALAGPYTNTLTYVPVGKRSLQITHTLGGSVITDGIDDGAGVISGTNIAGGSTINYATGAISVTFTAPPDQNTAILVEYGVQLATGDGVTTVFGFFLNGIIPGLPIDPRTLYIANTASVQNTSITGDTPTSLTSGDLFTGSVGITAGTIDYTDSSVATLTFVVPPPAAAADQDIWGKWQFIAPDEPIKGIKFFWDNTGTQETMVFNNSQMAVVEPTTRGLTNRTGKTVWNTTDNKFFSVANYLNKAWIVNDSDVLSVYDGTAVYQPVVDFSAYPGVSNSLTTARHVFIFKNRLLFLNTTENNVNFPQRCRYSSLNNPFDWRDSVQGAGGFVDAPTPEHIVAAEFLRDELIVFFQESSWRLRYTGIDVAPYRWEKLNETRRIDSPYATVGYQDFNTAVGSTGFVKCDGVNLTRYDEAIISYITNEVDQDRLDIINGFRYDQLNQQMIAHATIDGDVTDYSDRWLVWNFIEETFSTWNIPSTTFGSYKTSVDLAWQDFDFQNNKDWSWFDTPQTSNWFSYFSQGNAKIPLFGDKIGNVFEFGQYYSTDNGTTTGLEILTNDLNPFVKDGMQCRLGYVDFYFDRPTNAPDVDTDYQLNIDFFVDEATTPYQTVTLNPSEDSWISKRVYSGAIGNFHRFRIYLTDEQIADSTVATKGLVLNGFIFYADRGGRLIS